MSTGLSNTNNPWFAVSMGLIGMIVGYSLSTGINGFSFAGSQGAAAPTPTAAAPTPVPEEDNSNPAEPGDGPVLGKKDAPITLIEFSDIQCPFCRKWYRETYGQIKKEYIDTGKVKLVFRHYPLPFHPGAEPAAIAVACAQEQSDALAYAVHDAIFDNQEKSGNTGTLQYTNDDLKKWADDAKGLNKSKWTECFDGKKTAEKVKQDMADGQASGIDGTPGFWILGPDGQAKKISGAYPFAQFQTEFDKMLE